MVLAHAHSLAEAMERSGVLTPDLAVVGPNFTEYESLTLCRAILSRWPNIKVIIFSRHAADPLFQADAASAGANACLPREASEAETLAAVAAVMAGYLVFPREVLAEAFRPIDLTAREREVLRHLAEGKTDREIASALGLSHATVRNHSQRILEKLGVHERREVVRRARRS